MSQAEICEIYVCNNIDCKNRGADRVIEALRDEFHSSESPAIRIHTYMCFSACNSGPNVVIPNRRCWLTAVSPEDVSVVRDVVSGANPPQHLQQKNDPQLEALIFGIMDAGLLCPSEDA